MEAQTEFSKVHVTSRHSINVSRQYQWWCLWSCGGSGLEQFTIWFHWNAIAAHVQVAAEGDHNLGIRIWDDHRVWAPQARRRGPTVGFGGVSRVPPAESGAETLTSVIFFVYTDKIWANFSPLMCKHTDAEMGKSGQIRNIKPKTGQIHIPGELISFLEHVVKNRDCPRKSGTDGHLGRAEGVTLQLLTR